MMMTGEMMLIMTPFLGKLFHYTFTKALKWRKKPSPSHLEYKQQHPSTVKLKLEKTVNRFRTGKSSSLKRRIFPGEDDDDDDSNANDVPLFLYFFASRMKCTCASFSILLWKVLRQKASSDDAFLRFFFVIYLASSNLILAKKRTTSSIVVEAFLLSFLHFFVSWLLLCIFFYST